MNNNQALEQTIARLMSLADEAIQHATRGESDNAIWTRNDLQAALRTELSALAVQGETVGWMYQCTADKSEPILLRQKTGWAKSGSGLWIEKALYTTPQPAQPVQPKEATYDSLIDSVKGRLKMC